MSGKQHFMTWILIRRGRYFQIVFSCSDLTAMGEFFAYNQMRHEQLVVI